MEVHNGVKSYSVEKEFDMKVIQAEGESFEKKKVDTIPFRFKWTIIRTGRDDISEVKSTMGV